MSEHRNDASTVESSSGEEEELDPRIQDELECLNSASNEINCMETEIENARVKFRSLLGDSTQRLDVLYKKIGKCIHKVRPYYDLLKESKQAQSEAQRAVVNYQRAISMYRAAMETVQLAETRAVDPQIQHEEQQREFDQAWQEVLNHATQRFMESEADKRKSEHEHMKRANQLSEIKVKLKEMEKKWNRSIPKARPYFELKDKFELQLEQEKLSIEDLQRALLHSKDKYKHALAALEQISNSVHEKRREKLHLPARTPGVGAEAQDMAVVELPAINLDIKCEYSDESFADFDDSESISSDTVSIHSEGTGEKRVSIKGHRRYKSCDATALIASGIKTVSIDDDGYATARSDSSSLPQSPHIYNNYLLESSNKPSQDLFHSCGVEVSAFNTESALKSSSSLKTKASYTTSPESEDPSPSKPVEISSSKQNTLPWDYQQTDSGKSTSRELNQSKMSKDTGASSRNTVHEKDNKVIATAETGTTVNNTSLLQDKKTKSSNQLTAKGALPLLVDLAAINKDPTRILTI